MKLSIIIPYYKTFELTCELLDELTKQIIEGVEVILVDDGCNEKRLDKYAKDVNIVHLKENVGGASAMNKGLELAKGKYIAIIDKDDKNEKDYVETLLKTIDERKEDVIIFDWVDKHSLVKVHRPTNYAPWKAIYKKEIMPKFRDGWIYSYDVPFQEDLEKIPHTVYYLDKVLYIYNSNRPGSLTVEKARIIKEREQWNI